MQKFQVIGNIVAKPTISSTATGKTMCTFSVAVKRDYTRGDGERHTDFFNCVAWGGVADSIEKYCDKGSNVYLEGRIELRQYVDNQDIKRTVIDFIVDKTEFLPNGKRERAEETEELDYRPARRTKPTLQDIDDSADIPF